MDKLKLNKYETHNLFYFFVDWDKDKDQQGPLETDPTGFHQMYTW